MYLKKVFLGIFLVLSSCDLFAQSNGSSIQILHGYVVREFKKKEITDNFLGNQRTNIPVDLYLRDYFLPFGASTISNIVDSANFLKRNQVFFLPSEETKNWISKFSRNKDVLINNINYGNIAPYYEVDGKNKSEFLYQFYFVECRAIKTTIPNTSKNSFDLNIVYDKHTPSLICYFIFDIIVSQPILSINSAYIRNFNVSPHESGHMNR